MDKCVNHVNPLMNRVIHPDNNCVLLPRYKYKLTK